MKKDGKRPIKEDAVMIQGTGTNIFSQLVAVSSRGKFLHLVVKHKAERYLKRFSSCDKRLFWDLAISLIGIPGTVTLERGGIENWIVEGLSLCWYFFQTGLSVLFYSLSQYIHHLWTCCDYGQIFSLPTLILSTKEFTVKPFFPPLS